MPRPSLPAACAALFAGIGFAGPAFAQDGPVLPAPPADRPDLAAPVLPDPEDEELGARDPNGFEPVPSRTEPRRPSSQPQSRPGQSRPTLPGPDRVREGGVDARRFTPDPADPAAAPQLDRGDRDRPLAPGDNGYEYSPQSRQAAPRGLHQTSPNGLSVVPDQGLNPGGYYDPDYSPVLLGVSGRDTAEGVLITGVVAGTPAQFAGLEVGDRVLTVGGYQVGAVVTPAGPRVYPLGRELARRIGPTGEVTLLVQDGRTGRITNVTARPVPRTGPTDALDPAGGSYGPNPYDQTPYGPASPYDAGAVPGRGVSIEADPFSGRFGRGRRGVQYGGLPR